MDAKSYNLYLSAIKTANDEADKDALRKIQKDLIANYGLNDDDVQYLIKKFRYNV